jgi:hypothetical protein
MAGVALQQQLGMRSARSSSAQQLADYAAMAARVETLKQYFSP